jgi:sterol 3beta-glucosyltransferase
MAAGDPLPRTTAIVRAARSRGLGVLVATGWGGLALEPALAGDDVLTVAAVPHDAALPSATLAIHHGGAGTSHAVTRAGIPSIVVPFIADQPFWARALHSRGLTSRPLPHRRLDERRIAAAIDEAIACSDAARQTGTAMRLENGTRAAIDVIESLPH